MPHKKKREAPKGFTGVIPIHKGKRIFESLEETRKRKGEPKKEPIKKTTQEKRPTIDITGTAPKKDTSIRGQIERLKTGTTGSKILDNPVARILGSTKTTAILATTLGVLTGVSAIQTAATVGKSAAAATLNINIIKAGGSAFYKTNSASIVKTTSMIAKLLIKTKAVITNPGFIIGAIGSYPFSLFIKQEALQAIKGSYTGAMIAGDMEQAQIAMDERMEILDPNFTNSLIGLIPYVNSAKRLLDYFNTGRVAAAVDQQLIDKQLQQIETGETDEEYWADIEKQRDEKREQQRIDDEAYFAQVAENAANAKREARKEDQRYWDKVFADQDKRKKAQREAEEAYWAAVRIENDKLKQTNSQQFDNTRSNLNFGLL